MYKILNTTVKDEIINTTVEYTFADDSVETIEIPHFMPKDMAEVILDIENREISEQTKRDATVKNELIAQEIKIMIKERPERFSIGEFMTERGTPIK